MGNSDEEISDVDEMETNSVKIQEVDSEEQRQERRREYAKLLQDEDFRTMFGELFKENMKEAQTGSSQKGTEIGKAPDVSKDKSSANKASSGQQRIDNEKFQEVTKSPSDSMLYTPALKKVTDRDMVIDKNSNFVESIQAESEGRCSAVSGSREIEDQRKSTASADEGLDYAREKARNTVIEAEHYQAKIQSPGENVSHFANLDQHSDDKFFHLTCHVDEGLVCKIEAGEYVDLEKLLPREKSHKLGDETRLEWVHREGGTFLVPVNEKENRISGIRKWEQAFRAYATIYCGAHPQRAKEIW